MSAPFNVYNKDPEMFDDNREGRRVYWVQSTCLRGSLACSNDAAEEMCERLVGLLNEREAGWQVPHHSKVPPVRYVVLDHDKFEDTEEKNGKKAWEQDNVVYTIVVAGDSGRVLEMGMDAVEFCRLLNADELRKREIETHGTAR